MIFTILILLTSFPIRGEDVISAGEEISYTKVSYTYKIVDNHEIKASVYRNPGEEVRPCIVWIHGGALIFGTRNWLSHEQLKRYLNEQYTVISIDYRLAPETKLAEIIEDIEDAYSWIRTEGPDLFKIDPDRIAVVGHSAGGYLTLVAGFRLKPPPKALVSFYGYGDITGPWYSRPDSFYNKNPLVSKDLAFEAVGDSVISSTSNDFSIKGRFQFYLYCRQKGLWPREVSGHDPEIEQAWYSEYEPLYNVTLAYPPTILLHGEKDTDVPFEQSLMMAEAFKYHNVDYEFITNPDWGHVFDNSTGMKDSAVQEAFGRVLMFLERYLK